MDLDAYFARIGYSGDHAPNLATLTAIIRHHAAAIPFEAIDVLLGKGVDLAPDAVFDKLVRRKRGGYCYEQNGLLLEALKALGFAATPRLARVLWMRRAAVPPMRATHMMLVVRIDGRDYLADAGFGNGTPTGPLAFDTIEAQPTPLETFRLRSEDGGHRVEIQLDGEWAPVYGFRPGIPATEDFAEANLFSCSHEDSRFRRDLMLARATNEARFLLLGSRLTIRPARGEAEVRHLESAQSLEEVITNVFGLAAEADWRPLFEASIHRRNDQSR